MRFISSSSSTVFSREMSLLHEKGPVIFRVERLTVNWLQLRVSDTHFPFINSSPCTSRIERN